jgi:hypothetical protein
MPRLLLLLLLLALPAHADEPPACNAAREGATACLAGKLCTCRFTRGGSMLGRPDGHRWDCGVLRPSCGEAILPPSLPSEGGVPGMMLQLPPSPPFWR